MFLPDINFWLALTFEVHAHHVRAKQFFDSRPAEPFFFCRFTQQGFLRIASNATVFGEEAVSLREGWHLYDRILSDSRVSLTDEPNDLEQYWRNYTNIDSPSPKFSSDAYLAAFARAKAIQLVTFDQAFRQFKDLNCVIL